MSDDLVSRSLSSTALEEAAKAYRDVTFNALTLDECRDAATAAITAYLAQREKEGFVEVPNSALAWLFGEAPDADGHWFEPPKIKEGERKKPYWWRSKLRAMLAASQEQNE